MKKISVLERMKILAPEAIKLPDKFDKCIVGIVENNEGFLYLYSEREILILLQTETNAGYSKALKYFEDEILENAITPKSPVFLLDTN